MGRQLHDVSVAREAQRATVPHSMHIRNGYGLRHTMRLQSDLMICPGRYNFSASLNDLQVVVRAILLACVD